MIRFEPVDEPEDFDERARVPGTAWLAANPDARRPKDYWTPFKGALARGFKMYRSGELSPDGLEKKAPLIAAAIARA